MAELICTAVGLEECVASSEQIAWAAQRVLETDLSEGGRKAASSPPPRHAQPVARPGVGRGQAKLNSGVGRVDHGNVRNDASAAMDTR